MRMRNAEKSDAWRIAGAAAIVLAEIAIVAALLIFLGVRASPVFVALQVLSGVTLIALMGKSECDAYRVAWMGCVLIFGAAGVGMYLLFGRRHASRLARLSRENMQQAQNALYPRGYAPKIEDEKVLRGLYARGFPIYPAQECTYFPSGEAFWVSLLADIAQAQESVELEFFICCPGKILEKFL
jgi:cardiolipin synthase